MDPGAPSQKYSLIAELGHGGMADVYLAVLRGPTDFTKLAVVKRLRTHLAEDPEFLAMFLQEARIAARLNHPNVVHTFEVGHDGNHHFIAMEYLQGHPYSTLMSRVGREGFDFAVHLRILIETLEGLQHAHDLKDFDGSPLGLVHRDVSPQNVIITYDGQIKLLDFGIAKALDSAVETRTGVIKGKLAYMSPEQALAGEIDRRSDLYSVGVMLWEAAARTRRWKGLSNIQMMKKLVSADEPMELPNLAASGLPAELEDVLKKALARNPADRYSNASDFLVDLEKILDTMGRRVTARDVGKLVAERFKVDRERIDAVVESELKKVDTRDIPTVRPGSTHNLIRLESPQSVSSSGLSGPSNTLVSPNIPPGSTEHSASISLSDSQFGSPRRSRRAWFVAAAVVTGAAAATAVAMMNRSLDQPSPPSAQAAEPERKPRMVKVKVSAVPSQATLYFDGMRLGPNPYEAELPQSDREVVARAECAGFEPQERRVSLSKEVDLQFELSALAAQPATSGEPNKNRAPRSRNWRGPPATAAAEEPTAPVEPKQEPPPAETEPKVQPPPRNKPGAVLDSDNPWK